LQFASSSHHSKIAIEMHMRIIEGFRTIVINLISI
jgi:hypothetical protein